MKTMALTPKQARFVEEYSVDLNAAQAAIRAGYARSTAEKKAPCWVGKSRDLSTQPDIWDAVNAAIEARSERTKVKADQVVGELARLGFSNMGDYVSLTSDGAPFIDLSKLSREQWAAISEVTVEDFMEGRGEDARQVRRVKVKLHDKRGSLDLLGRHFGLFPNRHHVSAPDGGPVNVRNLPDDQLNSRLATFLAMSLAAAAVKGKR